MAHHIDDSEYSLHHRREIISILEGLKKDRVAIRLSTSHGEEFITSVLDVSSEKNHVYLDVSADEKVNSKVTGSKHVTFTTQTGVSVRWHSTHVSLIELTDGNALSILVPAVVQRIQRREYFRLPLPQGRNGLVCKITFPEEILEAPVKDMSLGGIGIVLKDAHHPAFSQGAILERCSIEFPDVGIVHFKLRVCGMRVFQKTRGGDNLYHIGMEFTDLSRGANNVIQRYMVQMECAQIAGEQVAA